MRQENATDELFIRITATQGACRQTGGNIRTTDQQAHRNTTDDLTEAEQNTGLKYKVDYRGDVVQVRNTGEGDEWENTANRDGADRNT